ncbi:MAG TPA: hypothetical protein VMT55_02515 [Candidatus Sulfotelmatobacter sp.]|nr:hypothetical protein [Candidatus Sulfotelmatobacter sp.]
MFFLFLAAAARAGSSPSYRITAEILDAGGQAGNSAVYRLGGKARGLQAGTPGSAAYLLGEGFLRSAYFGGGVILAPIVTAITPAGGTVGDLVEISALAGANFLPGAAVKLSLTGQPDINGKDVNVVNSGKITCKFQLNDAAVGRWNVTVTNPDGRAGTLPSAFQIVYASPQVSGIRPDSGINKAPIEITDLSGKYFRAGARVRLTKSGESDLLASAVTVVSAQKITCFFDLTGRSFGLWSVVVENDDRQTGTLRDAFKIEAEEPLIVGPVVSQRDPETGVVTVKYALTKDTDIIINVYNMRGERIWQQTLPAGSAGGSTGDNEFFWKGITAFKEVASSGVYFVYITAKTDGAVRKIGETKILIMRK